MSYDTSNESNKMSRTRSALEMTPEKPAASLQSGLSGEDTVFPESASSRPRLSLDKSGSDVSPPEAQLHPLSPSRQVGRYIILGELGRGAMGVVYRAWDPELERAIALKMLLWGAVAREKDRLRFLNEAKAVARVDHPSIVRVIDYGMHEGCPYLAMEYVEGQTLKGYLDLNGPLAPAEAATLIARLSRALHHVHERGIVHRDIKPANILLDMDKMPRLSDFGVAHVPSEQLDQLTATGQILGTPAYMSPEQAGGKAVVAHPTDDVYALGAVLFHLVTGHPPFTSETVLSVVERLSSAPPSLKRYLAPKASDLALVCQKALAPQSKDRYRSALLLAEDLERFGRGEPVKASPPSVVRLLNWRIYKHRGALLASLISLLIGLMGWMALDFSERWRKEKDHEMLVDFATRQLSSLLEKLNEAWAKGGEANETQADAALSSFMSIPRIRETSAPTDAYIAVGDHAVELRQANQAEEAYARAYLLADEQPAQERALLKLAELQLITGSLSRLTALESHFQLSDRHEQTASQDHTYRQALLKRQLDQLTKNLQDDHRPRMASVLQTLSRYEEAPYQASMFEWNPRKSELLNIQGSEEQRAFLMPRYLAAPLSLREAQTSTDPLDEDAIEPRPDEPTTSSILLRDALADAALSPPRVEDFYCGIDAPDDYDLLPVTTADGFSLTFPIVSMGYWHGHPLILTRYRDPDVLQTSKPFQLGLFSVQSGLARLVTGLPYTRFSSATFGDLDGDGRTEYYFGANRALYGFHLTEQGVPQFFSPHVPTNMSNSEVETMFIADLDLDGHNELVVGMGAWRAYDLRVFQTTGTGPSRDATRLKLAARLKLGQSSDATLYHGRDRQTYILATEKTFGANRKEFPSQHPLGLPVGTYLLQFRPKANPHQRLWPVRYFEAPFISAALGRVQVGDFDADGQEDVAVEVLVSQTSSRGRTVKDAHFIQLLTMEDDFRWSTTVLAGLRLRSVLQLDRDAADELLADESASGATVVLGKGSRQLEALPRHRLEQVPTFDDAPLNRLNRLISLGIIQPGIQQLQELASNSITDDDSKRALIRAGDLLDEQDLPLQALEMYEKAAALTAGLNDQQLWHKMKTLYGWLLEPEKQQQATEHLNKLQQLNGFEPPPEVRPSRARTLPPAPQEFTVPLSGSLLPSWQLHSLPAVRFNPSSESIQVRSVGENQDIITLPLTSDGGWIGFSLELEPQRLEWASALEIGLRPRQDVESLPPELSMNNSDYLEVEASATKIKPLMAIRLQGGGGGTELIQGLTASLLEKRIVAWEQLIDGPQSPVKVDVRLEMLPQQRELLVHANNAVKNVVRDASEKLPPGPLEFYIRSIAHPWPSRGLLEVNIGHIKLRGVSLDPRPGLEQKPDSELRPSINALLEGRLKDALTLAQALPDFQDSAKASLKQQLLLLTRCRQGLRTECAENWRRALPPKTHETPWEQPPNTFSRLAPWSPLALSYPGAPQWRTLMALYLRDDPELLLPILREKLGAFAYELFAYYWETRIAHQNQLMTQLGIVTGLPTLGEQKLDLKDPIELNLLLVELMANRASALRRLNQPILARQQIHEAYAAAAQLEHAATSDQHRADLASSRTLLNVEEGLTYVQSGLKEEAIQKFNQAITSSLQPELTVDELAAMDELNPLLRSLTIPDNLTIPMYTLSEFQLGPEEIHVR